MYEKIVSSRQIPISVQTPFAAEIYAGGPGDVVTTNWLAWAGLRAFSIATAGTVAVRIRRVSDNVEQDFNTLANGELDRASIATFLTATTGAFVKFYDKTGNGRHFEQATAANQAAVNLSGLGSRVTADFTGASSHNYATAANVTQSQPFTWYSVAKSNSGSGPILTAGGTSGSGLFLGLDGANTATIYAGLDLAAAATTGSLHALSGVANGASSDINRNGTASTGSAGSQTISATPLLLGNFGAGFLDGQFLEGGIRSVAQSGADSTSLSSNAHSFWGF